jgi:hypothetical protein
MLAASDVTGIAFIELLDALWGIQPSRLEGELAGLGVGPSLDERLGALSDGERASVADYVAFLAARHTVRRGARSSRSTRP